MSFDDSRKQDFAHCFGGITLTIRDHEKIRRPNKNTCAV